MCPSWFIDRWACSSCNASYTRCLRASSSRVGWVTSVVCLRAGINVDGDAARSARGGDCAEDADVGGGVVGSVVGGGGGVFRCVSVGDGDEKMAGKDYDDGREEPAARRANAAGFGRGARERRRGIERIADGCDGGFVPGAAGSATGVAVRGTEGFVRLVVAVVGRTGVRGADVGHVRVLLRRRGVPDRVWVVRSVDAVY